MLNILGMIILIIILFIIILLLIGIRISLIYDKKGSSIKGCLKILIFKKIKVYSHKFPSKERDEEKEEEEEDDHKQRDIKKLFKLAKPCFEDFKSYLKSMLNSISIGKIENHLVFGMVNYADTGKYIGIIWGIISIINPQHEKIHLSAEPSFNGYVFDGEGVNEFEIYPLKHLMIHPSLYLFLPFCNNYLVQLE